jgi:hypothetical protein
MDRLVVLRQLPKEKRSYELCLKAVKYNKLQIKYVPHKYKPPELFIQEPVLETQ